MNAAKLFNALHGTVATKEQLEHIIEVAKQENATAIIYRCSKPLNEYPNKTEFEIDITPTTTGLNAPRHVGLYKEALDECGRLRKGFKFENGSIVRVVAKKTNDLKTKILALKNKYNISKKPIISKGLNGVLLADGHEILTEEENEIFDFDDEFSGLNKAAAEVEEIINTLILEKIATGEDLPPWKQSWASKTSILAQNFETKKEYSGSNSTILNVLLGSIMPTPYYLTPNQVEKLGGQINKGAKTVPLVYYNFIYKLKEFSSKVAGFEIKRKGKKSIFINQENWNRVILTKSEIDYLGLQENEYLSKGFLKYYRVVNIADTTGIPYEVPKAKIVSQEQRVATAENVINSFIDKPKYTFGGKQAYFDIKKDIVNIPNIEDFDPIEEYYTTFFHELVHSTMHENRLNRLEKYKGKDEQTQYAFEELIAELGASYLAGLCGIIDVVYMNSASYLKTWHQDLQKLANSNADFFIYATKEAQKAVDFILQGYNQNYSDDDQPKATTYSEKEKIEAKAKALLLLMDL